MDIDDIIQPELCLVAPQNQPGKGTGYRARLQETSTKHRQMINEVNKATPHYSHTNLRSYIKHKYYRMR